VADQAATSKAETEVPALEAAIRRRLAKFPEDILAIDKASWLLDPRVVGEPLLWPLLAEATSNGDTPRLELLIINVILGPAAQIWRETARRHWTLGRTASYGDVQFVEGQLRDLETCFRALGSRPGSTMKTAIDKIRMRTADNAEGAGRNQEKDRKRGREGHDGRDACGCGRGGGRRGRAHGPAPAHEHSSDSSVLDVAPRSSDGL
jgi:hypothetical protein